MRSPRRRLRRVEVVEVLARGARVSSPSLSVTALPSLSRSAFAVVIAKKVVPKAVERNRLRRRVYALLGERRVAPLRAVFTMRAKAGSLSFEDLQREVESALSLISPRLSRPSR